jgi:hypothetical protein
VGHIIILTKTEAIKLKMEDLITTLTAAHDSLDEAANAESQAGIALTAAFDDLSTWVDATQLEAVSCVEDFQAAVNDYEKGR